MDYYCKYSNNNNISPNYIMNNNIYGKGKSIIYTYNINLQTITHNGNISIERDIDLSLEEFEFELVLECIIDLIYRNGHLIDFFYDKYDIHYRQHISFYDENIKNIKKKFKFTIDHKTHEINITDKHKYINITLVKVYRDTSTKNDIINIKKNTKLKRILKSYINLATIKTIIINEKKISNYDIEINKPEIIFIYLYDIPIYENIIDVIKKLITIDIIYNNSNINNNLTFNYTNYNSTYDLIESSTQNAKYRMSLINETKINEIYKKNIFSTINDLLLNNVYKFNDLTKNIPEIKLLMNNSFMSIYNDYTRTMINDFDNILTKYSKMHKSNYNSVDTQNFLSSVQQIFNKNQNLDDLTIENKKKINEIKQNFMEEILLIQKTFFADQTNDIDDLYLDDDEKDLYEDTKNNMMTKKVFNGTQFISVKDDTIPEPSLKEIAIKLRYQYSSFILKNILTMISISCINYTNLKYTNYIVMFMYRLFFLLISFGRIDPSIKKIYKSTIQKCDSIKNILNFTKKEKELSIQYNTPFFIEKLIDLSYSDNQTINEELQSEMITISTNFIDYIDEIMT